MPVSKLSPFARLVLFMVCLAIAGSIIGGLHYYAVDLPNQEYVQAPTNSNTCAYHTKWCEQICTPLALNSRDNYYACLKDLGCC